MTTIDALQEILAGIKAGRKWQAKRPKNTQWGTPNDQSIQKLSEFIVANYEIRLVPEPKLRPMRAEEFPPIWWFRRCSENRWSLVLQINPDDFIYLGQIAVTTFSKPHTDWQWSTTRKPDDIHSFFVEDVQ